MRVVLRSTLAFTALVVLVMRHTYDGQVGLILLCSCLRFGFGFIKLKWILSMYQ